MPKDKFTQICVWPACTLGDSSAIEFEQFVMNEFKVRVKYLEEIETLPDLDDYGNPVPETGDRIDLLFAIHTDDVGVFALPRLSIGIRWWEDVLASHNNSSHLYSDELKEKYQVTWDTSIPDYNGPDDMGELMDEIADAEYMGRSN